MFCPNCGHQYGGGKCPQCGINPKKFQPHVQTPQMQMPPPYQTPPPASSIHCPKCGSYNLQAVSDVQGKGASLWKLCLCGFLGLCGTGKTKTTHYWVCSNCGNRFKM